VNQIQTGSTGFGSGRRCAASALRLLLIALCAFAAALAIVSVQGCTTTRLPDGTTVKTTMAAATITPGRVETNADRAIQALERSPDKALELWQKSGQQLEK